MPATLEKEFLVEKNRYYTDGSRLYRIVYIYKDGTIDVENCETLFVNRIDCDIVKYWRLVK